MNYLILDTETSILNNGNPFTHENKLCYTGFGTSGTYTLLNTLTGTGYKETIQKAIDNSNWLVAFNAKFDCHWLERIGMDLSNIRIFDCQYAEFLFSNQQQKYPSLEESCANRGLGSKLDIIKEEYWNKGISTEDIPEELILEYLQQDLILTEKLYLLQLEQFKTTHKNLWRLFQLHMEDQVILRTMERNGILYETDKSIQLGEKAEQQIKDIDHSFNLPTWFNFNSGDHLSTWLYGGKIDVDTRIPVGVFKTGNKIGQTRYKIVTHTYDFPRQFEPIKGSELKKEGYYSTDDSTISSLKGTKETKRLTSLLNERSKLEKLRGTYYTGFPKKITEMGWRNNYLHPTFNQCVAVTGRLSSTNPNGQNQPPESKQLCISRFT